MSGVYAKGVSWMQRRNVKLRNIFETLSMCLNYLFQMHSVVEVFQLECAEEIKHDLS